MEIKEGYMPSWAIKHIIVLWVKRRRARAYHPLAWWTRQYPQLF